MTTIYASIQYYTPYLLFVSILILCVFPI